MEFKDYYQVLGVAREASADAIKKARRKLAGKFHPDRCKAPDAAVRMKEINEAYAVLSDPERRAAYDAFGAGHHGGEPFDPPPGWGNGFSAHADGFVDADAGEFSEFFEQLFGQHLRDAFAGARGHGPQAHGFRRPGGAAGFAMRGSDHHAVIELDLVEALHGAARQIELQSPRSEASARGRPATRRLDVKIPPGVRPGQRLRLVGLGEPGHGGAPAGDLLLEVHVRPHACFRLEGRDLHAELPLAPWEAALGAVVPVTLPDGAALQVRVPAGAQGGTRLTVRGKGLPGKTPGDLELTLQIVLPPADTREARALYERMARELAFDARQPAAHG